MTDILTDAQIDALQRLTGTTVDPQKVQDVRKAQREMRRAQAVVDEAEPGTLSYDAALREHRAAEERYLGVIGRRPGDVEQLPWTDDRPGGGSSA